jgi:hypothetical protein
MCYLAGCLTDAEWLDCTGRMTHRAHLIRTSISFLRSHAAIIAVIIVVVTIDVAVVLAGTRTAVAAVAARAGGGVDATKERVEIVGGVDECVDVVYSAACESRKIVVIVAAEASVAAAAAALCARVNRVNKRAITDATHAHRQSQLPRRRRRRCVLHCCVLSL